MLANSYNSLIGKQSKLIIIYDNIDGGGGDEFVVVVDWRVKVKQGKDNRHMKVVRLSALRTGRLYHSGNIPGIHFY